MADAKPGSAFAAAGPVYSNFELGFDRDNAQAPTSNILNAVLRDILQVLLYSIFFFL
jgi:hypothetical protein